MSKFGSVDEALDFAISREGEAARFYTEMAAQMDKPAMSKIFKEFAQQELGHKLKLEQVKAGGELKPSEKKVTDLKLADYLVSSESGKTKDYGDALTLAMKREKAAFKLYTALASATELAGLKDLFLALAQEEAKHKLYLETEYDQVILQEN